MVLKLPISVTLTPAERRVVELIGRMRPMEDRAAGIVDQRIMGGEIDVQAMGAEFAFARAANVYPDLNTIPRTGGYDTTLPSGITVDVKHTVRTDGNLICHSSKDKGMAAEIFVLVTGTLPMKIVGGVTRQDFDQPAVYTITGWAWGADVLREASMNESLPKPGYFIERGKLHTELPLHTRPNARSIYAVTMVADEGLDDLLSSVG